MPAVTKPKMPLLDQDDLPWRKTAVKVKFCTFEDLPDGIFIDRDWVRDISKLHFTPFFAKDTSWTGKPVDDRETSDYLVLLFLYEGKQDQLVDYPNGVPLREQFLKSLHQWTWADKKLHDIRIRSKDVTLSIGSYYIRKTEPGNMINEVDMSQFIDRSADDFVSGDNRPLVLYFPQQPKYENGDPVEITRGDRILHCAESQGSPDRTRRLVSGVRLEIPGNSPNVLVWMLWDKEAISFSDRKVAAGDVVPLPFNKFRNKLEPDPHPF